MKKLTFWERYSKAIFCILLVVILCSTAITLLVIQNKKEDRQAFKTEQDKLNAKLDYDKCIKEVWEKYDYAWETNCYRASLGSDCSLTMDLANSLDNILKTDKEECFSMYKLRLDNIK